MKTLFISALMLLVSCGKDNSSGKSALAPEMDPNSTPGITIEVGLQQDFINQANELLRVYHDRIVAVREVGPQGLVAMRNEMKAPRFVFSTSVLFSPQKFPARSIENNGRRVLYVGDQYPDLNWRTRLSRGDKDLDRMIMHELLEMVGISDRNFRISTQITN